MKNLPTELLIEKNKRAGNRNPWLILLEITLTDSPPTTLRFVRNNEDITYNGNTYTAFPFEIEIEKTDSDGSIPTVNLKVSQITRIIAYYTESLNGGIGSTITITVINRAHLAANYAELTTTWQLIAAETDDQWATFVCGFPNPLDEVFTALHYLADYCEWEFEEAECGYDPSAAAAWQATHGYVVGDRVKKTGDDDMTFRCYTAGTSDSSEPTWIEIAGSSTDDGTAKWICDIGCKRTLLNCQRLGQEGFFEGSPGLAGGNVRIC